MVYIGSCKSAKMANCWNLTDQFLNSKQRNRKQSIPSKHVQSVNLPFCEQSRTAIVDVIYLIAVVSATGYLIFPYIKMVFDGIMSIYAATFSVVKYEVYRAPIVYLCIGISILFAMLATIFAFKSLNTTCGIPNCRGLRKSPEFDIQIESEDCSKHSTSYVIEGAGKGSFKLSQDHHKDLEAELKKLAPTNGRAVLVFRANCGCPVGRMEVPGPKKLRKPKK